jgi:hypothetical protein
MDARRDERLAGDQISVSRPKPECGAAESSFSSSLGAGTRSACSWAAAPSANSSSAARLELPTAGSSIWPKRAVGRGAPGLPLLRIAGASIGWTLASARPARTPPFGRGCRAKEWPCRKDTIWRRPSQRRGPVRPPRGHRRLGWTDLISAEIELLLILCNFAPLPGVCATASGDRRSGDRTPPRGRRRGARRVPESAGRS